MKTQSEIDRLERKEEILGLAIYCWEDKGRLDGYSGEEQAFKEFPALKKAWKKYKRAKERIGMELREAQYKLDEEQYG